MFDSCMWMYMREERNLLIQLLEKHNVKENIELLKDVQAFYFVAHGSSYNACNTMASIISEYAKVRCYVYTPSGFRHNRMSFSLEDKPTTAVIGISQTGTSRGVLEALDSIDGYKMITITNEKNSPIDRIGDIHYYLQIGNEDSNAKTKGYSATLLILYLFALELGFVKGYVSSNKKDDIYKDIKRELLQLNEVIDRTIQWCNKHQYGKGMSNVYVVGNGIHFASAMEGQLKLMETMCIPTMFSDIVEFSHGMHRSLNTESYVILLNAKVDTEMMIRTMDYCKDKNIHVLMINGEEGIPDDNVINVGKYPYTLSVFSIIACIQAISAYVPEINGMDPNRNANDDYTRYMVTRV